MVRRLREIAPTFIEHSQAGLPTMESATPIRQELPENGDDASDDVALLFAAIFAVVRLLD